MIARTLFRKAKAWVMIARAVRHCKKWGENCALEIAPEHEFSVGKNSVVKNSVFFYNKSGRIWIGNNAHIGHSTVLIGPALIGDNAMVSHNVTISGFNHCFEDASTPPSQQPLDLREVVIGPDSWVGANAVILKGVVIGKHSIVGAGAVVNKNIPPYCVAVGNPAKIVKRFNQKKGKWVREPSN